MCAVHITSRVNSVRLDDRQFDGSKSQPSPITIIIRSYKFEDILLALPFTVNLTNCGTLQMLGCALMFTSRASAIITIIVTIAIFRKTAHDSDNSLPLSNNASLD